MKANVVRKLATERTAAELEAACEALAEERQPAFPIDGDDAGEQLTHALLAGRVRRRIEAGEDAKEAFRAEMAAVRDVLQNEG